MPAWLANLVMLVLYTAFGVIGLELAVPPGYATVLWPASGAALAGLLVCGPRLLPGVMLGSFLVNLYAGGILAQLPRIENWTGVAVAGTIAIGAGLQAFAASAASKRVFGTPIAFTATKQLAGFALLVGPLGCLIAPTVGVGALLFAGIIPASLFTSNWTTWWLGDLLGVVIVLPLALLAPWSPRSIRWSQRAVANFSLPTLLAILVPLALTFYAWKYTSSAAYERSLDAFERLALDHQHSLSFRLESYLQGLDGGAGLFAATDDVTLAEWRAYVDTLNIGSTLPGINGMGFVDSVPFEDMAAFLRDAAQDGVDLQPHPQVDAPANFIIRYIEPIAANEEAVGLNIAFEQNRYDAAIWSRDSGKPTITRRIFLVQDETRTPGFLFLRPLYETGVPLTNTLQRRSAFRGWVYAPFIADLFMDGLTSSQGETLDVQIYDGSRVDAEQLIFSSNDNTAANPTGRFRVVQTLPVYGQLWTIVWQSTPQFEQGAANNEALLIVVGGLVLTALLAFYLHSFSRREEAIRETVALKTREIAASEQRLDDAIENAPIGMALLDLEGRWLKINEAVVQFLGYSREELAEKDFQSITHEDDLGVDIELVQKLLRGEISTYQLEKRYIHKNGHALWGNLSVSLARDIYGQPAYFISQILDINDRKQMDALKSEFVSNVSHELRTPLTSIRGSLGLIVGSLSDTLPDNVRHLLRIAYKNSERLIFLINDILDLEKLNADKITFDNRPHDIAEIVRLSIEENLGFASDYSIALADKTPSTPLHASVDSTRLLQIMANLISNAVKFSPAEGIVEVGVVASGNAATIFVKDTGQGIPSAFTSRIFSPFSQADASATRKKGGTGLGLHITRQLVERMGGKISFETEEGVGTTFFVHFPLHDVQAPEEATDRNLPLALHIEDDEDFCAYLRTALQGVLNVRSVASLEEARAMLTSEIDMIILDLELPDGNGLDLLATLPADWSGSIVAVTASEEAHHASFDAVLVKSKHRDDEVISAIRTMADRHLKMAS
ncbi:hypothetical protein GCM10007989_31090 [Devosia pacifica]|uniref:histidine kinase n=1 Tax=Devosia pacifica TaxID=1335967 RepID=A0A918SAG0_9HYPH|nr:hypothetical protein GCM10007989_31090 [Devosia pacifica]